MSNQELPSLQTTISPKIEPIIVLRFKKRLYYYGLLALLFVMWFFIFGVMVPYLTTGDFAEIWPAHRRSTVIKAYFFAVSWVWWLLFPLLAPYCRLGNISFYERHVELNPHLGFFHKRTIQYDVLHAIEAKRGGFALINGNVPKLKGNIFNYWKTIYWDSISIPWTDAVLCNPESHAQAIKIIRERAITITIK